MGYFIFELRLWVFVAAKIRDICDMAKGNGNNLQFTIYNCHPEGVWWTAIIGNVTAIIENCWAIAGSCCSNNILCCHDSCPLCGLVCLGHQLPWIASNCHEKYFSEKIAVCCWWLLAITDHLRGHGMSQNGNCPPFIDIRTRLWSVPLLSLFLHFECKVTMAKCSLFSFLKNFQKKCFSWFQVYYPYFRV